MRNFTNIPVSEDDVLNRLKLHCRLVVGYATRTSYVSDIIYCNFDGFTMKIGSIEDYASDTDITNGRICSITYYPFYDKPSYIKINEKTFQIFGDESIYMVYEYLNTLMTIGGLE